MAIVRTTRCGSTSAVSFGTGAYTPTGQPFTPQNGSLLVAFVGGAWSASSTFAPTISDTQSLVWTSRRAQSANGGGWTSGITIFTAPVGTGASTTVSVDHGATSIFNYSVSLFEVVGHAPSPIGGTASSSTLATNGSVTLTLDAAPARADLVLAFLYIDLNTGTSSATPGTGTGWAELQDYTVSTGSANESQERTNSTSTTVTWDDTSTGASDTFRVTGAAIGIKCALPPKLLVHSRAVHRAANY